MKRLVRDSAFKKRINDMRIKIYVKDMFPFKNIFIASDDEYLDLISDFQKNITSEDTFSLTLSEDRVDGFLNILNEDDCLLAISRNGKNDFVRDMIKIALKNNVRVCGVYGDFKSGFAILSDDALIIEEDFDVNLSKFLKVLCANINGEYVPDRPIGNFVATPMRGLVLELNVKIGDEVEIGDVVCRMEAMKMENDITSDRQGVVVEIMVCEGDAVCVGDPLIRLAEM